MNGRGVEVVRDSETEDNEIMAFILEENDFLCGWAGEPLQLERSTKSISLSCQEPRMPCAACCQHWAVVLSSLVGPSAKGCFRQRELYAKHQPLQAPSVLVGEADSTVQASENVHEQKREGRIRLATLLRASAVRRLWVLFHIGKLRHVRRLVLLMGQLEMPKRMG